jgi:hypothetical protein
MQVQCTVQYSAVQYSTVTVTVQYSAVRITYIIFKKTKQKQKQTDKRSKIL